MDKLLSWLLISSADPESFSLTIKGVMLQYVGVMVFSAQLLGFPLAESNLVEWIGSVSVIVGTAVGMIGLARKLFYEGKALWESLVAKFG